MVCTFGGGTTALILNYCWYGHTIHVGKMVTAVMGSLVSYGSITFLCSSVETMIIGLGSALLVFFGLEFLDREVFIKFFQTTTILPLLDHSISY